MKLLDTTLRDGSYVINFQFSADDTRQIAGELDKAKVEFIEVGHGVGLGASRKGEGVARETDETYMKAAADVVTNGSWGMFCIPGIAEMSDLESAIDHDMGFVRVGVSIDRVAAAEPFVARAKEAGLFVAVNFMKSYTRPPAEFAQACATAGAFGADIAYLVDSAGNMLPQTIEDYVNETKNVTDVALGFHGHNNLGLANANALKAMELGVEVIDSSLQGMGRCTGNTITEHFVAILDRSGYKHNFDLFRLMDTSELLVRPFLTQVGLDSVDLACGLAGFHSSYMSVIRDACITHNVDPRALIMDLCEETRDVAPVDLVDELARKISAKNTENNYRHRFPLRQYFGHEQDIL
ncbi:4-hydroxy-2-oxovalerate aldolase [Roseibium sp. Sym1]|uniref:4-hydroxy-2-oxovalerate aldolase n=1 Tax=Roseibium sp. Sym1 TaxID=3016006 RepID=UPI0022B35F85|nr:4-hydroxy-2-oxovalerate aldolase [Roseibium sp. Sym1]